MSLRQKIENHFRNRSGQGSLVGVIVATVMLSMIVAAGTEWYLSMRKNIGNTEEKLEAQTIAMSEWERLSHMSLDELESSRDALKKPYAAGQFTVSVNLGQKGTFNNGTCGAVTGGYANCFKDTTITVSRDGSRLFTTRTLPLMAGDYTRKEIDAKLSAEASARSNKDTDLQNQINNLTARLNGKEFIKNKTPNYDLNLRYEKKAGEDKFTLHAYNGNTEIPLASQGGGLQIPDYENPVDIWGKEYICPSDGIWLPSTILDQTRGYVGFTPVNLGGHWYYYGNFGGYYPVKKGWLIKSGTFIPYKS